ncbi:hypothetical protein [Cytobacillus firmus]|uniref:hypothetical protein n=1 Tax=Cytobacillus firmus TaxID=1399 RepID=UPI001F50B050|nr:hypothetical protein [Cytobacillus firmus]
MTIYYVIRFHASFSLVDAYFRSLSSLIKKPFGKALRCVQFADYIQYSFKESGYENPEEYMAEFLIDLMNDTPKSSAGPNMDNFDWPTNGAEQVADMFRDDMIKADEEPWLIGMGISLWMEYLEKTGKQVKKPDNYVAGLRYLVSTIAPVKENLTQKEFGELYGINANRVSTYYGEIYDAVEKTIIELIESSNS